MEWKAFHFSRRQEGYSLFQHEMERFSLLKGFSLPNTRDSWKALHFFQTRWKAFPASLYMKWKRLFSSRKTISSQGLFAFSTREMEGFSSSSQDQFKAFHFPQREMEGLSSSSQDQFKALHFSRREMQGFYSSPQDETEGIPKLPLWSLLWRSLTSPL